MAYAPQHDERINYAQGPVPQPQYAAPPQYNPQQQQQQPQMYVNQPAPGYNPPQPHDTNPFEDGSHLYAQNPQQQGQLPGQGQGYIQGQEQVAGAGSEKLNYSGESNLRDKWFIVGFAAHLVALLIIAFVYGPKLVSDIRSSPTQPTNGDQPLTQTSDNFFIGLLVASCALGAICSIGWLWVMRRFSTQIIHISMIASIGIAVIGVIAAFASDNPIMGVFYIIIALVMCLYYYLIRSRIPFATAVLESSVKAIQENWGPIVVMYGLTLVQIAWLALWAFIFVAVWHAGSKVEDVQYPNGTVGQKRADQSSGLQFLQFFCVFSLYWTTQVIKSISHVTTAGVVASWWYMPSAQEPTRPAFLRAITTSLGTIIFGSLIIAIIQSIRYSLRTARRNACREIVDCLLGYLESAVKWFNQYALCTAAIYGTSFIDSAKRTGDLMKAQLFTAIINDDLSGLVLFAGSFVSGTVAGVIGVIWAASKGVPGYLLFGLLAFVVAFLVATLAMSVIQSAVKTTFVAWASDPHALLANRPVEFTKILNAGAAKYESEGLSNYSGQRV